MKSGRMPAERRREEIVQTALTLFARRSYDTTSVQQILDHLALSKGAFYHHFASKREVLAAVADAFAAGTGRARRAAAGEDSEPAPLRLARFLAALPPWNERVPAAHRRLLEALPRPENSELRLQVRERIARVSQPLLAAIVRQGVEDGHFASPWPAVSARLLLELEAATADWTLQRISQLRSETSRERALHRGRQVLLHAAERLLACREGELASREAAEAAPASRT
jgi:AcrR family transcriptional regulator